MKRVVFSLVGGSCLLVAAVALGQTSVLVAQKESPGQSEEKKPLRVERICLDWPFDFIDDNTVLYLCDDWPNFTTCDADPEAAYEYLSPTPYYPCDCGINLPSNNPYACQQPEWASAKKFQGLFACRQPDTDLVLPVTEHVVMNNNVLGAATAHVLYKESQPHEKPPVDRYTYIQANLPKSPQSKETITLPGMLYHIQVRNPPGYKKSQKDFYLALECKPSEKTKDAPTIDLDIVRQDKQTDVPYHAFGMKGYGENNAKGPLLMLTNTDVKP